MKFDADAWAKSMGAAPAQTATEEPTAAFDADAWAKSMGAAPAQTATEEPTAAFDADAWAKSMGAAPAQAATEEPTAAFDADAWAKSMGAAPAQAAFAMPPLRDIDAEAARTTAALVPPPDFSSVGLRLEDMPDPDAIPQRTAQAFHSAYEDGLRELAVIDEEEKASEANGDSWAYRKAARWGKYATRVLPASFSLSDAADAGLMVAAFKTVGLPGVSLIHGTQQYLADVDAHKYQTNEALKAAGVTLTLTPREPPPTTTQGGRQSVDIFDFGPSAVGGAGPSAVGGDGLEGRTVATETPADVLLRATRLGGSGRSEDAYGSYGYGKTGMLDLQAPAPRDPLRPPQNNVIVDVTALGPDFQPTFENLVNVGEIAQQAHATRPDFAGLMEHLLQAPAEVTWGMADMVVGWLADLADKGGAVFFLRPIDTLFILGGGKQLTVRAVESGAKGLGNVRAKGAAARHVQETKAAAEAVARGEYAEPVRPAANILKEEFPPGKVERGLQRTLELSYKFRPVGFLEHLFEKSKDAYLRGGATKAKAGDASSLDARKNFMEWISVPWREWKRLHGERLEEIRMDADAGYRAEHFAARGVANLALERIKTFTDEFMPEVEPHAATGDVARQLGVMREKAPGRVELSTDPRRYVAWVDSVVALSEATQGAMPKELKAAARDFKRAVNADYVKGATGYFYQDVAGKLATYADAMSPRAQEIIARRRELTRELAADNLEGDFVAQLRAVAAMPDSQLAELGWDKGQLKFFRATTDHILERVEDGTYGHALRPLAAAALDPAMRVARAIEIASDGQVPIPATLRAAAGVRQVRAFRSDEALVEALQQEYRRGTGAPTPAGKGTQQAAAGSEAARIGLRFPKETREVAPGKTVPIPFLDPLKGWESLQKRAAAAAEPIPRGVTRTPSERVTESRATESRATDHERALELVNAVRDAESIVAREVNEAARDGTLGETPTYLYPSWILGSALVHKAALKGRDLPGMVAEARAKPRKPSEARAPLETARFERLESVAKDVPNPVADLIGDDWSKLPLSSVMEDLRRTPDARRILEADPASLTPTERVLRHAMGDTVLDQLLSGLQAERIGQFNELWRAGFFNTPGALYRLNEYMPELNTKYNVDRWQAAAEAGRLISVYDEPRANPRTGKARKGQTEVGTRVQNLILRELDAIQRMAFQRHQMQAYNTAATLSEVASTAGFKDKTGDWIAPDGSKYTRITRGMQRGEKGATERSRESGQVAGDFRQVAGMERFIGPDGEFYRLVPDNAVFGDLRGKVMSEDAARLMGIIEPRHTWDTASNLSTRMVSAWKKLKTVLNPPTTIGNIFVNEQVMQLTPIGRLAARLAPTVLEHMGLHHRGVYRGSKPVEGFGLENIATAAEGIGVGGRTYVAREMSGRDLSDLSMVSEMARGEIAATKGKAWWEKPGLAQGVHGAQAYSDFMTRLYQNSEVFAKTRLFAAYVQEATRFRRGAESVGRQASVPPEIVAEVAVLGPRAPSYAAVIASHMQATGIKSPMRALADLKDTLGDTIPRTLKLLGDSEQVALRHMYNLFRQDFNVRREGAAFAERMLFDYSDVWGAVKWARTNPIGAAVFSPFITWSLKQLSLTRQHMSANPLLYVAAASLADVWRENWFQAMVRSGSSREKLGTTVRSLTETQRQQPVFSLQPGRTGQEYMITNTSRVNYMASWFQLINDFDPLKSRGPRLPQGLIPGEMSILPTLTPMVTGKQGMKELTAAERGWLLAQFILPGALGFGAGRIERARTGETKGLLGPQMKMGDALLSLVSPVTREYTPTALAVYKWGVYADMLEAQIGSTRRATVQGFAAANEPYRTEATEGARERETEETQELIKRLQRFGPPPR